MNTNEIRGLRVPHLDRVIAALRDQQQAASLAWIRRASTPETNRFLLGR